MRQEQIDHRLSVSVTLKRPHWRLTVFPICVVAWLAGVLEQAIHPWPVHPTHNGRDLHHEQRERRRVRLLRHDLPLAIILSAETLPADRIVVNVEVDEQPFGLREDPVFQPGWAWQSFTHPLGLWTPQRLLHLGQRQTGTLAPPHMHHAGEHAPSVRWQSSVRQPLDTCLERRPRGRIAYPVGLVVQGASDPAVRCDLSARCSNDTWRGLDQRAQRHGGGRAFERTPLRLHV